MFIAEFLETFGIFSKNGFIVYFLNLPQSLFNAHTIAQSLELLEDEVVFFFK